MIVLNALLLITVIGFLVWLVYTLAIYALPLFAGVAAGLWAHETGAGPIGGFIVGVAAAGGVLIVGQLVFTFARPLWVRLIIGLLFAGPAAVAGYAATHGVAELVMPSEGWQIAFSILGAIAVAIAAMFRMAGPASTETA